MKEQIKIECEGKTVQEAIENALSLLKVKSNEVKVEILCEEEKGLFGMPGARLAKVRVIVLNPGKKN